MVQQTISIGAVANDGTGNNLRTGGEKINDNFTELYGLINDTDLSAIAALTTTSFGRSLLELANVAALNLLCGVSFIRLPADYVLTSTTSLQKLFNTTTNGQITLTTGIYRFESQFSISGLSATSGNGSFQLGGTAVLSDQLAHAIGRDDATPTTANAQTGSFIVGSNAHGTDTLAATSGTAMSWSENGTIEVTTAGTVIPSIALTTAAAGTVKAGSHFIIRKIAELGVNNTADWT